MTLVALHQFTVDPLDWHRQPHEDTMRRSPGTRALMARAVEMAFDTLNASGVTKMPFASVTLGAEQPLLASEIPG